MKASELRKAVTAAAAKVVAIAASDDIKKHVNHFITEALKTPRRYKMDKGVTYEVAVRAIDVSHGYANCKVDVLVEDHTGRFCGSRRLNIAVDTNPSGITPNFIRDTGHAFEDAALKAHTEYMDERGWRLSPVRGRR